MIGRRTRQRALHEGDLVSAVVDGSEQVVRIAKIVDSTVRVNPAQFSGVHEHTRCNVLRHGDRDVFRTTTANADEVQQGFSGTVETLLNPATFSVTSIEIQHDEISRKVIDHH